MSDPVKSEIEKRVDLVNDALTKIANNLPVPDAQAREVADAALALLGVLIISAAEIADSVGRMANLTQSEFETQVAAGVDDAADKKIAESKKRSFFGQPT